MKIMNQELKNLQYSTSLILHAHDFHCGECDIQLYNNSTCHPFWNIKRTWIVHCFVVCIGAKHTVYQHVHSKLQLTVNWHSETQSSKSCGRQSKFCRTLISWPTRVSTWRLGKYSIPVIWGNPEKNISNTLTFFPAPFRSLSGLMPFTAHCTIMRNQVWFRDCIMPPSAVGAIW